MSIELTAGQGDNYWRAFSLGTDFMEYVVDDLLLAYMIYAASWNPNKQAHYLSHSKWIQIRPTFVKGTGISAKTVGRHIDELIRRKLVQYDEQNKMYIFPQKFSRYVNIDGQLLRYLIIIGNQDVIKIYIYLLNKYQWFTGKAMDGEYYDFTLTDLKKALSYSEKGNKRVEDRLRVILFHLAKEGFIQCKKTYKINNDNTPYPVYRLFWITETFQDRMRAVDETDFLSLLGPTPKPKEDEN